MLGKDNLGRFTAGNSFGGKTGKSRESQEAWDSVIGASQVRKLAKKLLDLALNGKGMVQFKALTFCLERSLGKVPDHITIEQESFQNPDVTRQEIITALGPDWSNKMKAHIAEKYKDVLDA